MCAEPTPRTGCSTPILETDPETGAPRRIAGEYERDEPGQAEYVAELLDIFDDAGVDSTFVFIFALHDLPHRPHGDPRDDLDLASVGIVKVLEGQHGRTYPDMPWEPKAASVTVAEQYAAQAIGRGAT